MLSLLQDSSQHRPCKISMKVGMTSSIYNFKKWHVWQTISLRMSNWTICYLPGIAQSIERIKIPRVNLR